MSPAVSQPPPLNATTARASGESLFAAVGDAADVDVYVHTADAELAGPVIVEGNYLLLDAPEWRALGPWDLTVFLDVPMEELERRLSARWAALTGEALAEKMDGNDLPNARLVRERSVPADVTLLWPKDDV